MHTLFPVLTPLFLSKILIAVILLAFLYNLLQAGIYGKNLSIISKYFCFPAEFVSPDIFISHKKYAKRTFWIAVLAVITVETVVRLNEPLYDTLFWIHLSVFAIPCFLLLALIRFKYTGLKYPKAHGKLIYYGLLPTLVGTLLTGIPLLYRL